MALEAELAMSIRRPLGAYFAAWGRVVLRYPWTVLVLSVLLTAVLAAGLARLRIDASIESMLKQSDAARLAYDAFREQFGSDERLLLVIRAPELFTLPGLEQLRDLHRDLEHGLPHLDEVTSLVNARATRGTETELLVDDFLDPWPLTAAEAAAARERAIANPAYRGFLISEDALYTVVTVDTVPSSEEEDDLSAAFEDEAMRPSLPEADGTSPRVSILTPLQVTELMEALGPIVARHESDTFQIEVAGTPAANFAIVQLLQRDLGVFTLASLLAIGAVLWLIFRRAAGVVLPLLVVLLSLLATVGAMGLADLPITPATQILPSFLIAVGVGYAVHLLALYFRAVDAGGRPEEALVEALGHSGPPILLASLTTAGSLASFRLAELALLSDFGIAAPLGVLLAFFDSVVLLPALLAVAPSRPRAPAEGLAPSRIDGILTALGDLGSQHPLAVVAVTAGLTVIAGIGAARLQPSHAPVRWLPEENPVRRAVEIANERLLGSTTIEVILEAEGDAGFRDPEMLGLLDQIQHIAESLSVPGVRVGNGLSLADLVKETHQALHGNDPRAYAVPSDPALLAQELLLLESSARDELEKVVDPTYRTARLSLLVTYGDALDYKAFLRAVRERIGNLVVDRARVHFTGLTLLTVRSFDAMLQGMIRSYGIALVVIVPIMIWLMGGVGAGLVSMIPNLVPIVFAMGVMSFAGIPLDAITVLIGCITIGVAVDDTIHFMHNFRRSCAEGADAREAVRSTLCSTGRAMLVTSVVLCIGFLVFAFASMRNLVHFGVVTALAIATAFLADVILSPALVTLLARHGRRSSVWSLAPDVPPRLEEQP